MPYLFDTDAVSELLRSRPDAGYAAWVRSLPWEDQFISAVTVGELFRGAYRDAASLKYVEMIERRVLSAVTVLPFDTPSARVFGVISAALQREGTPLEDPDLQIAATATRYSLELVTGNIRHFERVPGLVINQALADTRRRS